jgi:hypothetical protein
VKKQLQKEKFEKVVEKINLKKNNAAKLFAKGDF